MNHSIGSLTIETFISATQDFETNQYIILGALKKYTESFRKNKIYPPLSELIELMRLLREVLDKKLDLDKNFPRELLGFDTNKQKSIYQTEVYTDREIETIFNLITWSLPKINKTIEAGIAVFDYIDDNIKIKQVGIQPMYKEEGYLVIPDHQAGEIKVYRYESSIFSSQDARYPFL